MSKKITIDLNELRSEYESTYLAYVKGNDYMEFEEWLKKVKGIIIKK